MWWWVPHPGGGSRAAARAPDQPGSCITNCPVATAPLSVIAWLIYYHRSIIDYTIATIITTTTGSYIIVQEAAKAPPTKTQ